MDDFDLRDLLSPPLRHCAEERHEPVPRPYPMPAMVLGMAYVPEQAWGDLYEPEEALKRGTLFRNLEYPFMSKGGQKE